MESINVMPVPEIEPQTIKSHLNKTYAIYVEKVLLSFVDFYTDDLF